MASCVGFTDSQIYNFVASSSVILHEYLLWKREKQEKEKQIWLLKKSYDRFIRQIFLQCISKHSQYQWAIGASAVPAEGLRGYLLPPEFFRTEILKLNSLSVLNTKCFIL